MKLLDNNVFWGIRGEKLVELGNNVEFAGEIVNIECPCIIKDDCWIECKTIGAYTKIGNNTNIRNVTCIGRFSTIGNNCKIGKDGRLYISTCSVFYKNNEFDFYDNGNKHTIYEENSFSDELIEMMNGEVHIGSNVWIGDNVVIYPGVYIGSGVIIKSGCVITSSVQDDTIVDENGPRKYLSQSDKENQVHNIFDFSNEDEFVKVDINVKKNTIVRIEDGFQTLLYSINTSKKIRGGISGTLKYNTFTRQLYGRGWILPSYSYDVAYLVINKKKYRMCKHIYRGDVLKNYPQLRDANSGIMISEHVEIPNIPKQVLLVAEKNGKIIFERSCNVDVIDIMHPEFRISQSTKFSYIIPDFPETYSPDNLYTFEDGCFASNHVGGKRGNIPFWFYCVFENNRISYKKLNKISELVGVTVDKMLKQIKCITDKKLLFVYGNCQSITINSMLATSKIVLNSFLILDIPPIQDLVEEKNTGVALELMQEVDVFITQFISENNKFSKLLATNEMDKRLRKGVKKIIFPNMYWKGYFPQYCRNNHNPQIYNIKGGIFPYGDMNIENLWNDLNIDEIVKKLSSEDFYSKSAVMESLYDSTAELVKREEVCDVIISDFIMKEYQDHYLFYTVNHPTNYLVAEMVKRILEKLNICDVDIGVVEANDARQIHIYPSVRKQLNLSFDKEMFCYLKFIRNEDISFADYIRDYIMYCKEM